ncbi:unnamed protein product [Rangifer tarandus platyrhynchus]|uniref:Uncharacterized protein n=1 Tax=Rangifer tarandus platyrhynchus TaxID=3082113 RepID=A0AC59YI10_RANTA
MQLARRFGGGGMQRPKSMVLESWQKASKVGPQMAAGDRTCWPVPHLPAPSQCTPWTIACQAPLSMGFSGQEYRSGLPFPSPGDLPNTGIEPRPPALQADSLPSLPPGKPTSRGHHWIK